MNDQEHKNAVNAELLRDQRAENHDIRTELKHVRAANIRLVDANTRLQEDKEALTGEVKKLGAENDLLSEKVAELSEAVAAELDRAAVRLLTKAYDNARRWSAAWKLAAKKHRQQALYWYFWGQRILSHYKKAQAALTRLQDTRLLHDIAQLDDRPEPEACPECGGDSWAIGETLTCDCGWWPGADTTSRGAIRATFEGEGA
jgi:hypothetical protein